MARVIMTLEGMGKDLSWTLVQQARGIPDAKGLDDYLTDRTIVVLFARPDLSERLCVTAAIRQMSGHVIYMGPEERWAEAVSRYPAAMLGSMSYYMDGVILHGIDVAQWKVERMTTYPILNDGSNDAHPDHALAELMCMQRHTREDLRKAHVCWLGYPSGTLISLMEATKFFPITLSIALPEDYNRAPIKALVDELRTEIVLHDSPQEAVKGCNFVYGGSSGPMHYSEMQRWRIDRDLMAQAADGAHVLAGTNPVHCVPVEMDVVDGHRDLFLEQAENRLRIYKRIFHWMFEL